ncbi:MAG: hypothetical protein IJZ39_03325 [Oscillospiraceae bacterium]|nr:hypothetical protein [Oscillospiraceae bacterium]
MIKGNYSMTVPAIVCAGKTFCVLWPDAVIRQRVESFVLERGGILDERSPDYLVGDSGMTPVQFWIGAGEFDRIQKHERLEEALVFLSADAPFSDRERENMLWYIRENREEIIGKILEENLIDTLRGYLGCYHQALPQDYTKILEEGQYRDQILLDLVDELIERTDRQQKHELKAWLLEYKKNTFPESFVESNEQDRLDKELGFLEQNEYDWLKLFSFVYEEEGVHILDYKGAEPMVFVPPQIGGRPVTSIAARSFFARDEVQGFYWQRPAQLEPAIDRTALAAAQAGDTIAFGLYPENKSADSAPLQWQVLKKEGTRLLVISKYCIDKIPYHREQSAIDWAHCDLRKWFNGAFFHLTFTPEEQAMIPAVTIPAGVNPKYKTPAGRDTTDRVFALTLEEAGELFDFNESRIGYTTLYAQSRGYYFGGQINCWWLRGPGVSPEFAALVGNSGSLGTYGYRVDENEYAVRPAMWIDFGGNV